MELEDFETMNSEPTIRLFDVAACAASMVALADPALSRHLFISAHVAHAIGEALGMPRAQCAELIVAGLLHDIAALDHKDRIEINRFEFEPSADGHQRSAQVLLSAFEPLRNVSEIVGAHHCWWHRHETALASAHALHLGERVAMLVQPDVPVLGQAEGILKCIRAQTGKMFGPDYVDALCAAAERESFWFDAVSPDLHAELRTRASITEIELDLESLSSLARLFVSIIDFRSQFTSTHSSGVAATAETLAGHLGFSGRECRMLRIAGFLHDLGKLAVPCRLLDKPGRLTRSEFDVIKTHPYHTMRILRHLSGFGSVAALASSHHERLDGKGYPYRLSHKDLPLASRVLAVADIYAALTEHRPYRDAMRTEQALGILRDKADSGELDGGLVAALREQAGEVDASRIASQTKARSLYETLRPAARSAASTEPRA